MSTPHAKAVLDDWDRKKFTCPNGCDLRGEPIPDECFDPALHEADPERCASQKARYDGRCTCLPYGDKPPEERFFSLVVGIYDWGRDRTVEWLCPKCAVRWPR